MAREEEDDRSESGSDSGSDSLVSSGSDASSVDSSPTERRRKAAAAKAAERKRKEGSGDNNSRPKKKPKAYKFLDLEAGEEDSDEEEFEEESRPSKGRAAAHQQDDWASRPNRGQKRFGDLIQRWEERAKNEEQQAEHAAAEHEQRREVGEQRREIEARRQAAAAAAAAKMVHPSRQRKEGSGGRKRLEERRAAKKREQQRSGAAVSSPSPSDGEKREHSLGELPEAGPLPEPSDSKLFLVKCFDIGHEREIITRLSTKYEQFRKKGVKTGILSAFASDSLKGYIYIEGKSVNHIKRFVTGIRQINTNSVKVVPATEMLGVFRSAQEAAKGRFVPLKMGEWVRIKRHPIYSNDLAQVVECFDMDVEVKIRPRINYEEDPREAHSALFGRRTTKKPRPHASFFDPIEAENRGGQGAVERVRYRTATNPNEVFDQYRNERYKDGYLYRRFKRNALLTGDDVQPSITEISEFLGSAAAGGEGQALLAAAAASMSEASGSRAAAALSVGDSVVVNGGDMKNLRGRVVTIDTDRRRVNVDPGHGRAQVTVAIKDLSKHFDMGDHVKILDGASAGDTGTVIKLDGSVATILTDNEPREVKCQSSNLKLTSDVSKGIEKIGQYKVGDLVTLNVSGSSGVGVIVSIAASGTTAKIIGNDNRPRNVPVGSLGRHRDSNVVFLMDVNNNPFKPGALLKILAPHPLAGKGAQVKHIMNNVAWVKVNDRLEDGGIVAITGHQVELVANRAFTGKGKGGKGKGRGGVRPDDLAPQVGSGHDQHHHQSSGGGSWGSQWGGGNNKSWGWNSGGSSSSWGHHEKGSGGKGGHHGGGKGGKGDSRLVGKRILIIKGIYKSQRANVIDVTDTKVYVQLEAKVNKRLFIPKDQVRVESEIAAAESSGSVHVLLCMPLKTPAVGSIKRKAGVLAVGAAKRGRGTQLDRNISFVPPSGTRDFFPDDMRIRDWLFSQWRAVSAQHGFSEYDAPVLENEHLYKRKAGEEIVEQMYNFVDKEDHHVTLRPEMTPTLARMVLSRVLPLKWFSIPQCWRFETTQRGRKREHYQWNCDIVGISDITAELELLATMVGFFKRVGLTSADVGIKVNSRAILQSVLKASGVGADEFAKVCVVIDKIDKIGREEVQRVVGVVSAASIEEFKKLADENCTRGESERSSLGVYPLSEMTDLEGLFDLARNYGIDDWLVFDASVVRGLAYYTGIVWEAFDRKGELRAIAGGGRYDRLLSLYGAPSEIPCVGFGFGDCVIYELLRAAYKGMYGQALQVAAGLR
ncbi:histidyl-tRNA synthetase, putative [Perkinsus marinus ATCC 50983]|uniref:histidine--tRNA ligase n=1 Tax=Perkinsus marinus (strain ATCC 50983 / TXsc) TaxID=423536 RepID=C5KNI1_PERM5|nr:histidyl-tRNA synthetase, putative [Perkinsus marinus ATCC 50983]EER13996.1 histidyl-tRNA synthetase, putative [Perkinsus marinus ATCC 50983]|eukprot:XP_002782201.1 histidyl-tRNA synthetase, putative [Perkinsus marinus ATCC 50983]